MLDEIFAIVYVRVYIVIFMFPHNIEKLYNLKNYKTYMCLIFMNNSNIYIT